MPDKYTSYHTAEAHTHTHGFLEQIDIVDKQEQKKFFSHHQLNFFTHDKTKKKKLVRNINLISFISVGVIGMIIAISSAFNNEHDKYDRYIDYATTGSAIYASDIGQDVAPGVTNNESIQVEAIANLIQHPSRDKNGHLYVNQVDLQNRLNEFYQSSIRHDYGNFSKFEYLLSILNSPFISSKIKTTFSEQAIKAFQVDYRNSMQEISQYLKKNPPGVLSNHHDYWKQAQDSYVRRYKLHYVLLKFLRDSENYSYSVDNEGHIPIDFSTLVSTDEFIQAVKTGVIAK
jgi:hypothetical protein